MQIEVAATIKRRVRCDAVICGYVQRILSISVERGSRGEQTAMSVGDVDVGAMTLHRAGAVACESASVKHPTDLTRLSQDPELSRERAAGFAHAAYAIEHPVSVVRMCAPKGRFQRQWLAG